MTSESDKGEQQERVDVAQYQDLLAKLSPDEAFFELANSPIVSFRIDSSSTVSDVIRVEQKQELENSCGGIVWESAFALAEYLRKCVLKNRKKNQKTVIRDCIDIGAGTGFLGIWIHKTIPNMERTVVTDTIECFDLMQRNVERNFSNDNDDSSSKTIDVKPLDWTSKKDLDALATTRTRQI